MADILKRADFIFLQDRVLVNKHFENELHTWIDQVTHPVDFNWKATKDWLTTHGYTVHEWNGGARAWLGQPWPVRTKNEILNLRNRLSQELLSGNDQRGIQIHAIDLAFDY